MYNVHRYNMNAHFSSKGCAPYLIRTLFLRNKIDLPSYKYNIMKNSVNLIHLQIEKVSHRYEIERESIFVSVSFSDSLFLQYF